MLALRILILSFLIPDEIGVQVGDLALSVYRIVLIALTPYILKQMISKAHRVNWNSCDLLAVLLIIWPFISFGMNTGFAASIESGGIFALEMAVPYFLVRLLVNSRSRRVELAKYVFQMTAVLFFLGLPEALLGQHFTHQLAHALVGESYTGMAEQRFGIWRALGPLDHAILFGTLCTTSVALSLNMMSLKRRYLWILAFSIGGAILSASSAPILSAMVQLSLYAWATTMQRYRNKWLILVAILAVAYLFIDVLSNRDPIRVMFSYLLLNPTTGYARYYMWILSFDVVAQSTWGMVFGYGYDIEIFNVLENDYWRILMQNTVDSFWLVVMLRHGITMLILFAVFVILVLRKGVRSSRISESRRDRRLIQAWFICALGMTLVASTVHFWGQMVCVYFIVLATCVGASTKRQSSAKVKQYEKLERRSATRAL